MLAPPALPDALDLVHGIRELPASCRKRASASGIPLNLVQKWLGHAQLTTTVIYADAVGAEEKDIARRLRERV